MFRYFLNTSRDTVWGLVKSGAHLSDFACWQVKTTLKKGSERCILKAMIIRKAILRKMASCAKDSWSLGWPAISGVKFSVAMMASNNFSTRRINASRILELDVIQASDCASESWFGLNRHFNYRGSWMMYQILCGQKVSDRTTYPRAENCRALPLSSLSAIVLPERRPSLLSWQAERPSYRMELCITVPEWV